MAKRGNGVLRLEPARTTALDCQSAGRTLRSSLIAFFGSLVVFLFVVYALAPEIYVQTLLNKGASGPTSLTTEHPLVATLFLVAILLFVAALMVGVWRGWRWVFWLVLAAFAFAPLSILGTALEMNGIATPAAIPVWYGIARIAAAIIQMVFAVWMFRLYRRCGVWGMRKAQAEITDS